MHKKSARIMAIIGVILLLSLYISSLVFALISHPLATLLLKLSFIGTIVIPVMLYVCLMFHKAFTRKNNDNDDEAP